MKLRSIVTIPTLIFTSSLLLCATTYAEPAGVDDIKCASTKSPFEVPTRINEGSKKFSGECIDSKRFRPAVITAETNSTNLVFQNYLHNDKYWKAELPKNAKIEASYVQVVRFSIVSGVTAAHVQLRAKLAPGSEIKLSLDGETTSVDDIVVSYEAARPKDISYNFAMGVVDNYLLVGRVASGEQRLSEYSTENKTEQYELSISSEESRELLLSALNLSASSKFDRFYNTLKPNCTTEIFDLIDELPSQKLKGTEPFLTMISNDPVAGPTIDGLKERGILKGRYANLRDEKNGVLDIPADDLTQNTQLNLLASVEGYPYSLILSTPENAKNSPALKDAKKLAYNMAPQLLQRLASSLMLSGVDTSTSLLESLKDLTPFLKEQLNQINGQLTDTPMSLVLYLSPWDQELGKNVDALKELGVPAKLPFKTYETNFDMMSMNEIHTGLNDAADLHAQSKKSFGLTGLAVQLYLVKDHSTVTLQAVGQLGSLEKELIVANDQVNIKQFIIPESIAVGFQPVGVLTLSQNMTDTVPSLNLSFGNLGPLVQDPASPELGQLKIHQNENECFDRRSSTPKMKGDAAKLSLIGVLMDIFSVDFDLEKQVVSNMDVRVSTSLGVLKNCESDPTVNKQFTDSVNAQISDQKAKLGQSPGLTLLNQILSNNKDNKVSGFQED